MFISTSEYENENMTNYSYELKSKSTSQMTTHTPAASMKSAQPTAASAATGTLSLELLNEHFNMNVNENVSFTLPPTPTPLTLLFQNESTYDSNGTYVATPRISSEIPIWLIPCYGVIFFFAIFGNLLVISTLVQNRRMRNVTNVFLLNLAISDMLLGVLCMPVTLVGTLLRHFIFGEFFCKLIQFSQAASVAVSSWTLVAISCERYYAICHPLRSRTWQTINHAYRIIGFIWFGSIVCMTPIAVFSQLIPTSRQGLRKCRDQWPEDTIAYERFYNIFLDLTLLVLPLFVLCVAYILITRTLYVGMRAERALIFGGNINSSTTTVKQHDDSSLGAIATVTKSATATTADATLHSSLLRRFNLKMSVRRHSSHDRQATIGSYDIRSNDKDIAAGAQSDTRYHQQQLQQLKYYDDPGNEAISHKSFATVATKTAKTQKNLFDLRVLSCVDSSVADQQMDLHQKKQREIRNNTTREARCYNNGNKSEPSLFTLQPHRFQQQARLTLRANLSQHNGKDGQNFWKQTPLQLQQQYLIKDRRKSDFTPTMRNSESTLRRSNEAKNLESKKRVVKMLFVLVLEFFICWTPLYVINTIVMFIGPAIYEYIDYTSICFFQLLAYSSSCCNPITYCFMNASFRRAFLDTFKGMRMSSGTSRRMSEVGFSSWVRRRRRVASGSNSVSCTQLPTLATNNSISLTNNTNFVPNNNTTTHNSPAPPQSN